MPSAQTTASKLPRRAPEPASIFFNCAHTDLRACGKSFLLEVELNAFGAQDGADAFYILRRRESF